MPPTLPSLGFLGWLHLPGVHIQPSAFKAVRSLCTLWFKIFFLPHELAREIDLSSKTKKHLCFIKPQRKLQQGFHSLATPKSFILSFIHSPLSTLGQFTKDRNGRGRLCVFAKIQQRGVGAAVGDARFLIIIPPSSWHWCLNTIIPRISAVF